jgi:hypothetical protein
MIEAGLRQMCCAALLALALAALHGAGNAADTDKNWSIAKTTRPSDGRVIVYRYVEVFEPAFKRAAFPDRITVSWPYRAANGLPSKAEFKAMDDLENILEASVEAKPFARLVLVRTGDNLREWVYYAASQQQFMARVNHALQDRPVLPLQFGLASDPDWRRYEDFRSTLAAAVSAAGK